MFVQGDKVGNVYFKRRMRTFKKLQSTIVFYVVESECFFCVQHNFCFDNRVLYWYIVLREDSIGFIKIDHFRDGSAERFRQDYLACRHLPYLILNLEDNGGGLQENVNDIATSLVGHDVLLENIPVRCDSALRYTGKIFVLMNTFTASAAECLVACLKGQSNVTVIGQRSAGDCGSWAYNFRTRHGLEFKLATRPPFFLPDGKTLSEGMGITPDMETRVSLPWEKEESLAQALTLIWRDKHEWAGN